MVHSEARRGGPTRTTVLVLNSRGPVCTGGRQVKEPGSNQSQLPRIAYGHWNLTAFEKGRTRRCLR